MNVSSTTSSSNYSRITGMATGMDTDAMVKQMLAGEQAKIDSTNQSLQYVQWQQEAYVDIIKDFKSFYSSYLDILAPSSTNMMLSGVYTGMAVTSTNSNSITATALPGAVKGNYEVEIVNRAEGAKVQSGVITDTNTPPSNAKLSNTLESIGVSDADTDISIVAGGMTFNVTVNKEMKISELVSALKNAESGGSSKVKLSSLVDISYSELTSKFTIESKETGSIATGLKITGNLPEKLGIETYQRDNNGDIINDTDGNPIRTIYGVDGEVKIKPPGETSAVSKTITSNKFTVDNIIYDISDGIVGDKSTLTVKPDASNQVEKFKKFVEGYNKLVEKITTKLSEKKSYSYKPLTAAQKEDMSDEEIEKWETQAKKGILKRDSNLSNLMSQLRGIIYTKVEGAGISISDVGITTTANYNDGGKLQIDEEKLKNALETNGDAVQKLFTQSGTNKGVLQNIKETLNNYIGSEGILVKKSGYENTRWVTENDLSKKIEEKNTLIYNLQKKFSDKQERLYSMFAALEKNMNNLNSQSTWLASQLG